MIPKTTEGACLVQDPQSDESLNSLPEDMGGGEKGSAEFSDSENPNTEVESSKLDSNPPATYLMSVTQSKS